LYKYREALITYHAYEFARAEGVLNRIQREFIEIECKPTKGRTAEILVRLSDLGDRMKIIGNPVVGPKVEGDKLRTCLLIYQKYNSII